MHTIYIFGLGPTHLGQMPKEVYDRISNQDKLYLRTLKHPAAQELKKEGLDIVSFDDKYEEFDEDFERVYPAIVEELIHLAETKDVYYGVPGHPAVAETTVQLLLNDYEQTKIIGGKSFIDDLFAAVNIDPIQGFQLMDSFDLNSDHIFQGTTDCYASFHSLIASEVKLALMEIYPDDHRLHSGCSRSPEESVL